MERYNNQEEKQQQVIVLKNDRVSRDRKQGASRATQPGPNAKTQVYALYNIQHAQAQQRMHATMLACRLIQAAA
jgi:hypothetical protein